MIDVIVVGGGAAGLSATLVLGRQQRQVMVVDSGRPRNAPAAEMTRALVSCGPPRGDQCSRGRPGASGSFRGEVTPDSDDNSSRCRFQELRCEPMAPDGYAARTELLGTAG